jgi:hypothetical protein
MQLAEGSIHKCFEKWSKMPNHGWVLSGAAASRGSEGSDFKRAEGAVAGR